MRVRRGARACRSIRKAKPYLVAGFVTATFIAWLLNLGTAASAPSYTGGMGRWGPGVWQRSGASINSTHPSITRAWLCIEDELRWASAPGAHRNTGENYPAHWSRVSLLPFWHLRSDRDLALVYERVVGFPFPAWYGRVALRLDESGNWQASGPALRWPWREYPRVHRPPTIVGVLPIAHGLALNSVYYALAWYALLSVLRAPQRFIDWIFYDAPPMSRCCHVCGYDLRATPRRCPECGANPRSPSPPGSTNE